MATIRKLRSKWQAQVRIKGHKPQAKSFTLRSDAVAWARQVETEIQRGLFVDTAVAEQMTVRDAIERYLTSINDQKKQRIERSTARPVVASSGHISLFNLNNQHLVGNPPKYRDVMTERFSRQGANLERELDRPSLGELRGVSGPAQSAGAVSASCSSLSKPDSVSSTGLALVTGFGGDGCHAFRCWPTKS